MHTEDSTLYSDSRLAGWRTMLSYAIASQSHKDVDGALQALLARLGALLHADRCFLIRILDSEALPVELEYTSGPEIFSYKGLTPPWGLCPFLRKTACKEFTYTRDALEDVSVQALPMLYEFFKEKGVRGGIGCPVVSRDELTNILVLHTAQPRDWKTDELALVRFAAKQISLQLTGKEDLSREQA